MNRLVKFNSLKVSAWYSKLFNKLNNKDLEFCINFIETNSLLDKSEYEKSVNRLFLDQPELRLKHKSWKNIIEICSASNI